MTFALVAPSPLATPRRTVVGWDSGRLAMVLAVLDARCGLRFAGCDVYLNVAGGLRVVEPAADLAVADRRAETGAGAVAHGEQGDFVLEVDEALDDDASARAAAALDGLSPSGIDIGLGVHGGLALAG